MGYSYWINRGEDILAVVIVVELFKMRYDQLKSQSKIRQEKTNERATVI
jgi:hypothetical protein